MFIFGDLSRGRQNAIKYKRPKENLMRNAKTNLIEVANQNRLRNVAMLQEIVVKIKSKLNVKRFLSKIAKLSINLFQNKLRRLRPSR